mmetsp:Transcript_13948/g.38097  ORF Transcript_13948/g.38097 Transcript_13948/m.38097 type:complete len:810 (+) Transcript_13948:56-2485(+)
MVSHGAHAPGCLVSYPVARAADGRSPQYPTWVSRSLPPQPAVCWMTEAGGGFSCDAAADAVRAGQAHHGVSVGPWPFCGIAVVVAQRLRQGRTSCSVVRRHACCDKNDRLCSHALPKVHGARARGDKRRSFRLSGGLPLCGDQPTAVKSACEQLSRPGKTFVTISGATGTGKTLVMGNVIQELQTPTLVLSHNRVLAHQLHQELSFVFPANHVFLFVSPFLRYRPAYCFTRGSNADVPTYVKALGCTSNAIIQQREQALSSTVVNRDTVIVATMTALFGCFTGLRGRCEGQDWRTARVLDLEYREKFCGSICEALERDRKYLHNSGDAGAAHRLVDMVERDMQSIMERGWCEEMMDKYASHMPGYTRSSLLHSFNESWNKDWLLAVDESHATLPHLWGAAGSSRTRQQKLFEAGYRLRPAQNSGPLTEEEFWRAAPDSIVFASATPGSQEKALSKGILIPMVHRPTHILDPLIEVKQRGQDIKDMIQELKRACREGQQVIVACLSQTCAIVLKTIICGEGMPAAYLHCGMDVPSRDRVMQTFREGKAQVLIGIGLVCEGVDVPGVGLVIVLEADRNMLGYRSEARLTQLVGRASRHVSGRVVFYCTRETDAMLRCIERAKERRRLQEEYNERHGFVPTPLPRRTSSPSPPQSESSTTGVEHKVAKEGSGLEDNDTNFVWELPPEHDVEHLALVGDGSDIAPKCNGIGAMLGKTLLSKYGSLENVIKAVRSGDVLSVHEMGPKRREYLLEHADVAKLAKERIVLERLFRMQLTGDGARQEVEAPPERRATTWRGHVASVRCLPQRTGIDA